MAKQSSGWLALQKRWLFLLLLALSLSTLLAFILRAALDSTCHRQQHFQVPHNRLRSAPLTETGPNPLSFMKYKLVLLVSHELSLSGGPLLLMELAFLLRGVGAKVCWMTNQKSSEMDEVVYSLEHRMLHRGVQVLSAKGQEAVDTALKADLVVLNTAVAGKWLDAVLKENVSHVLPKVLWWIHEMRGHYFKMEYVKHLPLVAGAMIDSHVTAEYWKNRTQERLKIKMPETYVVHLGNSKELMNVAEDSVATRVLREHVRESLGVRNEDILFAIINSVSRGKGQDLFLRAFYDSLQLIQEHKLKLPSLHAIIVGSDMTAQTKFESELRNFVVLKKIQNRVHFVNKTLTVAPYLAAVDVLVQNSQVVLHINLIASDSEDEVEEEYDEIFSDMNTPSLQSHFDWDSLTKYDEYLKEDEVHEDEARGECFGRITIEAMAFHIPVLGTSAGGTTEIVVNESTGLLHPVGKEGVTPLAKNIVKLATHVERRLTMGKRGYERVKEMFLERQMAHRIAAVLKEVLQKANNHKQS
ncbi:hypothetical protein HYC85_005493 [Camellia sinensis]|uniref:Glycosyl transferase family 1 domain-containing protein n=1 Tax=Camellia sinensis TaxID=4442 RepID=A0A7J7I2C5_CAMSI|nr:hypothetical protein HYC85_005493 [Camellia sinensis]